MERWGTLSVKDHMDARALATDLLLYDRLVVPVFTGPGERLRWRAENWDPELQERCVEELGDLVVRAPWDEERRQRFADLRRATSQIATEAFQTTRLVLAMDETLVPPGTDIRVVAAFHSRRECKEELQLSSASLHRDAVGRLGFVLAQRLLVPKLDEQRPAETVKRAADLSRRESFRARRREFYEWQERAVENVVSGRQRLDGAIAEMDQLVRELNEEVRTRVAKRVRKSVFTIVGASLPIVAAGRVDLVSTLPAIFELVKFALFDFGERPAAGKCEAAAMFLLASKKLAA